MKGAFSHIVTDLYTFLATAAAGAVIVASSWERADAAASLVVAVLMVRAAWGLLREAGRILLQAAPDNVSLPEVRAHIVDIDHVIAVYDLHAWTLSSNLPTLSAHVVVDDRCFLSAMPRRSSTPCRIAWAITSTSSTPPFSSNRQPTPRTSTAIISSQRNLPRSGLDRECLHTTFGRRTRRPVVIDSSYRHR